MELHTKGTHSNVDQTGLKRIIESAPELTRSLLPKLKITLWLDELHLGLYIAYTTLRVVLTASNKFPTFNNEAAFPSKGS